MRSACHALNAPFLRDPLSARKTRARHDARSAGGKFERSLDDPSTVPPATRRTSSGREGYVAVRPPKAAPPVIRRQSPIAWPTPQPRTARSGAWRLAMGRARVIECWRLVTRRKWSANSTGALRARASVRGNVSGVACEKRNIGVRATSPLVALTPMSVAEVSRGARRCHARTRAAHRPASRRAPDRLRGRSAAARCAA